jgi:hypothetical protein
MHAKLLSENINERNCLGDREVRTIIMLKWILNNNVVKIEAEYSSGTLEINCQTMTNCRDPQQLNIINCNCLSIKCLIKRYYFRIVKLNEKFGILYRPTVKFVR